MKTFVFHTQKFKAILRVLEANTQIIQEQSEALAAKQNFSDLIDQMSALITELTVPVKSVYLTRVRARKDLVKEFGKLLKIGITLANRSNDEVLLTTLKSFAKRHRSVSTSEMIEFANYFLGKLSERSEQANALGITQEIIDRLQAKTLAFTEASENVALSMGDRRSRRMQLAQHIKDGNRLLRNDLDNIVSFNSETNPDFILAYNRVRWSRRRRVTNINIPLESDISGMVKDADTGLPIPGATLNLIEHAHAIEAGADGYYLFDELEAGEFTLTCHASGYEVPESVIINLNDNDSYIHNFNLVPIPAEA